MNAKYKKSSAKWKASSTSSTSSSSTRRILPTPSSSYLASSEASDCDFTFKKPQISTAQSTKKPDDEFSSKLTFPFSSDTETPFPKWSNPHKNPASPAKKHTYSPHNGEPRKKPRIMSDLEMCWMPLTEPDVPSREEHQQMKTSVFDILDDDVYNEMRRSTTMRYARHSDRMLQPREASEAPPTVAPVNIESASQCGLHPQVLTLEEEKDSFDQDISLEAGIQLIKSCFQKSEILVILSIPEIAEELNDKNEVIPLPLDLPGKQSQEELPKPVMNATEIAHDILSDLVFTTIGAIEAYKILVEVNLRKNSTKSESRESQTEHLSPGISQGVSKCRMS
ncbi:hypothetical protein CAPTEDRAFT_202095 [Capitella teleta]|uniref:Uncharacterized protein n=1 Tax=Capitella teleta TaxID=283909 RepID=R7U2W5_CAPTE|nr:hypothetical protein CAPTEDRAFT_202095 [Capitella teleta]|eukprot:ELU00695.1 hypothetical protein CAPTEDRAFT_202095 [Capitella teleta]